MLVWITLCDENCVHLLSFRDLKKEILSERERENENDMEAFWWVKSDFC